MGTWWWKFFGIDPDIPIQEIINSLDKAKAHVSKGRNRKGDRGNGRLNAYEEFRKSREVCEKSLRSIQSAAYWGRIGAVILAVTCVVLTLFGKYVLDIFLQ